MTTNLLSLSWFFFFVPTKSEHIRRHIKVGVMDTRNMQSGGRTNYQHSNQESRRWARARARTVRRSRKRDSDMRRLHTNGRLKKQQRIIKTERHFAVHSGKVRKVKMHMYEGKKKISTWDKYEGERVQGRGVQSLIPTGKTFRLDLSFFSED